MKFHENLFLRAELIHADRRTDGQIDMTKLIEASRNFAMEPRKKT